MMDVASSKRTITKRSLAIIHDDEFTGVWLTEQDSIYYKQVQVESSPFN